MRIPKSVTIAGHTVRIMYRKRIVYNGAKAWGLYDDDKHIIYLTMGMEKTRKVEVFLHECLHAIEYIHTLTLPEKAINLLGIEIMALIRNNKLKLI